MLRCAPEHQEAAAAGLPAVASDLGSLLLTTSKCVIIVGAVLLVRRMSANLLADVDPFSETPLDTDITRTRTYAYVWIRVCMNGELD